MLCSPSVVEVRLQGDDCEVGPGWRLPGRRHILGIERRQQTQGVRSLPLLCDKLDSRKSRTSKRTSGYPLENFATSTALI